MSGDAGFKTGIVLAQHNCQQKKPYNSVAMALNAGWLLSFKHKIRFSVYPCPCCTKFHLSKQVGRTSAVVCTI